MWPLSRAHRPKPLLPLLGPDTMLQLTATRFHGRPEAAAPIIVAHAQHADEIARQLADCGVKPAQMILEPVPRNTAAAIALAALAADADDLLLVMPSDHAIGHPEVLCDAVLAACPVAEQDWIVTFGVTPTAPHTGYGYIQLGSELRPGVHRAERFEEKPSRGTAESFLSAGGYYWNAGIFLFRAAAMLDALRRHEPAVLDAAKAALADTATDGLHLRPETQAFARSPSISIDHAVIERAERVAVAPVAADWSDVGSWDGLYQLRPKDEAGNAVAGDAVLSDVQGSLVIGSGVTVAALGVADMVVVATPDAVLIVPRHRSEEIKIIVEELKARGNRAAD
jgi:mannose-1-phosphate guanylyltransferase